MAREITLANPVVVEIQPKIEETVSVITNVRITLDDGGCVLASWNVGSKSYNMTLWDAQTTPTYEQIGQYTDGDIENRIKEIVLNS
jgi:hypothetical protein